MSFTPLREIVARANPAVIPDTWTFDNYEKAWNATPFGRFVLNSFIQTGIITGAQVFFSILAGYAFAMFEFRGKNVLFVVVIGSLIVPFELTFIPNFLLISDLGWANTYAGLTVPFLASAFGVFMMRQFFMSHPPRPLRRRQDRRRQRLEVPVDGDGAAQQGGHLGVHDLRVPQRLEPVSVAAGDHQRREHANRPDRNPLLPGQPGTRHRLGSDHGRGGHRHDSRR